VAAALVAVVAVVAAGFLAVQNDVLPGRIRLETALGACNVDAPVPDVAAGPIRYSSFASKARGTQVTWGLALPPGTPATGLPVALVLHGRGDDARSAFDELGYAEFLADHVRRGGEPFALVAVDGGDAYWHPRASGDDPLTMITDELLPRLASRGLATDDIAITGWSMGGYGSLLMKREFAIAGSPRVVASAASSPALFDSFTDASPGAFDDEADWRRYGYLVREPSDSYDDALFVASGRTDAFADATRTFRASVDPTPSGEIGKGCHDQAYWRSQIPAQLDFISERLSAA
jgi:S-formylglutathione hydrolase FrmB